MQGRIQRTDRHWQSVHLAEDTDEVFALIRRDLRERGGPFFQALSDDHLANRVDARSLEEHVLRTAQSDAFRAEAPRNLRVGRRVGVGPNLHRPGFVGPLHQGAEVVVEHRID